MEAATITTEQAVKCAARSEQNQPWRYIEEVGAESGGGAQKQHWKRAA